MFKKLMIGFVALAPQVALAQTAADAVPVQGASAGATEGFTKLEDVIVTARRAEERLQTTPVAVTAVTNAMMERAQIFNSSDLQRTAPSLLVSTGAPGASGIAFVSIRGEGNLSPLVSNDPAVGIYADGVYIPRPSQGITSFHDVARIEVLRGPQGTLFGRNTTGGAISAISNDPVDRFEAIGRVEYGNYDFKHGEVIFNAPLTEGVAARIVYDYRDRDGYGDDPTLGRDIGSQTSHFVRGKLKFEGDNFDLVLSGDYDRITDNGQLGALEAYNPAVIAGPLGAFAPALQASLHTRDKWYTTYSRGITTPAAGVADLPADIRALYGSQPYDKLTAYGFGGVVNVDLGFAQLKSITGYRYSKSEGLNDTDGSPAPVLATIGGNGSKQVSQELQFSGDISERLRYITGGYISRETGYEFSYSQIFGGRLRRNFGDATNIAKGLYLQAYYDITETVRFTGGFRYTWDTRKTDLHNMQVLGLPGNALIGAAMSFNCSNANVAAAPIESRAAVAGECSLPQSAKFDYPAWTIGVDWQATPDIFVYAKASAAAKAGGWNLRAGALPAFAPEKVKDVEAGLKGDFFDSRLRTNVALFYAWKTDVQAVVSAFVPPAGSTQYTQNNGKARIYGAEFEVTALPWEGMELTGNLSLLRGHYVNGSFTEVQIVGGVPTTVDLSSLPLPQLPKAQFSIGATQTFPLGDGELTVHGDFSYVSAQNYHAVRAAPTQSAAVQAAYARETELGWTSGYGLLNGRIGYTFDKPDIEFYVFGRNLTDKKYVVRSFSDLYGQLGISQSFVGAPRTYGVGLSVKY